MCNNSQTNPIICRSTTDCFKNSGLIHSSSITKKDISKSTLGTYRHFSHDSSLKTLNNNKHSNNMFHSEIPDVNSRQFTAASYKDDQDSSIETRVRSANTNDGVIIDADGVEHDIVEHGNNVQYEILDEQGRTLQVQGDIQKLMQMAGSVKEVRQHDGTVVKEYILDDPRILSQLRSSLCSECPDNGNVKGCQMTSYNENHGSNTAVSSNNTSSNQTIPLNSTHIMSPQMQLTSDVPKFIYPHQHPNINEQYANQSKQSYSQNNAYTDNYRDNLQSNESSAVQRKFSHSRDARPIAMLYPPPPPPRSSLYASRLNNGQDIFDNVVLQSRRGTPLNNELSNVGIPTDHCTLSSSSNNNAHVNCNDNNRYHLSGGFNGNFGKDRFWRSRGSRSAATSPAAISMCGTSILELSPGNLYELTTSSGYVAQLTLISNRNSVIGSNQEANFNCIPTNIDLAEIALAIEQKLPPFIQAYYTKQQLQISALQHFYHKDRTRMYFADANIENQLSDNLLNSRIVLNKNNDNIINSSVANLSSPQHDRIELSVETATAYDSNNLSPLMAPPLLDLSSIDPQLGTYEIDENGRIIGDIPPILSEEQILFIKKQLAINGIPVDLSNIKPTNSSNNFDKNDKNQTNTNKTRSDEKGLNHSKNTNNISNNFLRRYGDVSRNNNEASSYSQNHRQLRKS
ncbi:hypothetical protein GJ496_010373 [Pomphorhynchus laevis]|nr:hypothetical protein GJ496_010373 [Pomphorhynchus laevis]